MKKRSITRKLITSIATATMTAVCLTTSTYAWFSRNETVWIQETDLYIDTYDGLLISLDGNSFSQDISSDELKKVITNKTTTDEARTAYEQLKLIGTTMKQDAEGKIVKGTDGIEFTHDVVNHIDDEYINTIKLYDQGTNVLVATLNVKTSQNEIVEFTANDVDGNALVIDDTNKDSNEYLIYNSANELVVDLADFEVDSYVRETFVAKASATDNYKYIVSYVDNGYTHNDEASVANENYLQFDLYFRISSDLGSGGEHSNLKLKFTNDTYIKSSSVANVTLNNSLSTQTKDYVSGDNIEFDVANAMRIATDSKELNIFEVTNDLDLGSVAIEGSSDAKHDKNKNAMYTYYNSLFPKYPFKSAAANGDRFNTKATYTDDSIGTFVYNSEQNKYDDLKVTIYVWLEGWDADYFLGTSTIARQMSIKLDFGYYE